ncbi:MAG: hotdog fold thioesterase [Bacteroidota bacterium]
MTAQKNQSDIAYSIYEKMMDQDYFSQWMGVELIEISEGYCKLQMIAKREMLNGFGILHGGISFAFADSALAFASNSHGRLSVSLNGTITYAKTGKEGDILIAEAKQLTISNRTGTYDVTVSNQTTSEVIALFRGTVFRTDKQHLESDIQ